MTQPTPTAPDESLAEAMSLSNNQNVDIVMAFGVVTQGVVDAKRVTITAAMADALRPKARQWLRTTAGKTPVAYETGYHPDSTEVAFFPSADNAIATAMKVALFPPMNLPPMHGQGFLLEAGFMAVILASGNRSVGLIKRITASKVVLKPDRKFFGLLSDNETLVPVAAPIIELDHNYHALLAGDHLFMVSIDESERLFGLEGQIVAKLAANVAAIAAVLPVSDPAAFTRVCQGNRLYRKKLQSVVARGVFSRPVAELKAFVEAEQLSLQFVEVNGAPQLVVEETNEWLRDFLRFLDEDFMTGGITSTKYIANSKRKR